MTELFPPNIPMSSRKYCAAAPVGFHRVDAFINVPVNRQIVMQRGFCHELPHSPRTRAGERHGVEAAFEHGNIRQLERQVFVPEGLLYHGEIRVFTFKIMADRAVQRTGV